MGRLPTEYNRKRISYRVPYVMYSEIFLSLNTQTANTFFSDNDFLFDADKPFEIHRMIPWGTLLSGEADPVRPVLAPTLIMLSAEILIRDNAKNVSLTKDFTSANNLVRGFSHQTWEWEDPYYLTRGEGLTIAIRSAPVTPAIAAGTYTARHMLAFEGFLLALEGEV